MAKHTLRLETWRFKDDTDDMPTWLRAPGHALTVAHVPQVLDDGRHVATGSTVLRLATGERMVAGDVAIRPVVAGLPAVLSETAFRARFGDPDAGVVTVPAWRFVDRLDGAPAWVTAATREPRLALEGGLEPVLRHGSGEVARRGDYVVRGVDGRLFVVPVGHLGGRLAA